MAYLLEHPRRLSIVMILYGAFKGMGDFICAAPALRSELESGEDVTVLVFPQVLPIIDLLDLGDNAGRLSVCTLPVKGSSVSWRQFIRNMGRLKPSRIYISPHAPRLVASWRIPLLLWVLKRRHWPGATLIGADSEPLSWLFDLRIPVNRHLPYMLREWTAYSMSREVSLPTSVPPIKFKPSVVPTRPQIRDFDLVIHPGAGTDNRKWPMHYFGQLLGELPAHYRIAVVGIPRDVAAVMAVAPPQRKITFLSGSLTDTLDVFGRARLILTMDSGSMFFARLLHVPTVTLFGPSNPNNVMSASPDFFAIYSEKWSCQPCRRPECAQRRVYCMEAIDPGTVLGAILDTEDRIARTAR